MPAMVFYGILLLLLFLIRLALYKPQHEKLKNSLFFLLAYAGFWGFYTGDGIKDTPMVIIQFACLLGAACLMLTSIVCSLGVADAIARRKKMNPKRHESGRQPVRHGCSAQQPVRHGEAAEPIQPAAPHTPASQPNVTAAPPTPTPEAPKPPVRQTLRTCVRCGHNLTGPFCGECGYNHTGSEVRFLRFVDPERLQISVRKF